MKINCHVFINNECIIEDSNYLFKVGSLLVERSTSDGSVINKINFSKLWQEYNRINSDNQNYFFSLDIKYLHPNKKIGIQNFNFLSSSGNFIALMGSSGSGKSTLLNILNGSLRPTSGVVTFNGEDIHQEDGSIKRGFGYVPQDDLLMEDLTVFQNLYYSALLSLPDLKKSEVKVRVIELLEELGLLSISSLKVGSVLDKVISGGQRKRLNIALELIRNPDVLFIDEPTSGLSSRDSVIVMRLLRSLCFKGTLVISVIHQPSSEIYKLFDMLILLDDGGYCIYKGDPINAVSYFKECVGHISNETSCIHCGSINPEIIFDIVEDRSVDKYGKPLPKRRVSPIEWSNRFNSINSDSSNVIVGNRRPKGVKTPSLFFQFLTFMKRDFLSKVSNTGYVGLILFEPILLSLILSFVLKFSGLGGYHFSDNVNIPSFMFVLIIISIFMGLSISAEEIFRDEKILKREKFLQLSRVSYLLSKISIQFLISFIQTILFLVPSLILMGNFSMFLEYFLILFACASFGNILALNISSALKSANTIYILIPILLIPQLILGGIIVDFNKMNPSLSGPNKVPLVADFITSRWAFEALCVTQFKDNNYNKLFYDVDKRISELQFKKIYLIPELKTLSSNIGEIMLGGGSDKMQDYILTLKNEIIK